MLIKSKVIFTILVIFVLIGLASVNAADFNQTDKAILENDQGTSEISNFTDLNDEISKIPVGENFTLKKEKFHIPNDIDKECIDLCKKLNGSGTSNRRFHRCI